MDKVGICNIAIGNLGISQFIGDIAEESTEARTCRIYYDHVLDSVLESIPWGFARAYADLQDIGSPPSKWLYRYRYPTDCLFARAVVPRGALPQVEDYFDSSLLQYFNRDEFEIVEDQANDALSICCNIEEASLTYTKRITSVSMFSALFVETFGWALASKIAAPLSALPSMAQAANQAFKDAMLTAAARSMNEGKESKQAESEFITARL